MSRSSAAEKKQRVSASNELVNTLRLVPTKNLPLALEFEVLSFADFEEIGDFAMLSKATGVLVKSFLKQCHSSPVCEGDWSFDAGEHIFCSFYLMAHCAALRRFNLPNVSGSDNASVDLISDMVVRVIQKNRQTLQSVNLGALNSVVTLTTIAALATLPNLQDFIEVPLADCSLPALNSHVLFLAKRCRNITNLQLGTSSGSSRDHVCYNSSPLFNTDFQIEADEENAMRPATVSAVLSSGESSD
jgi:hypothetical protein